VFVALTLKVQTPRWPRAEVVYAGTETVTGARGTPAGSVATIRYPLTTGIALIGLQLSVTVLSGFSVAVRLAGAGGGPDPR
jgi:hypothetical protein